ncbi:MAG: hypothetical protein ACLFM0_01240 [Spirochaetales bacterium]
MMFSRIPVIALLAVLLVAQPVASQDTEPQPYEPDEFPRVARDLRRFQIVTLGSVPLTLFFSSLGYRIWRIGNETELSWRDSGVYTQEQRDRVLTIGLSLSVGVGVLDYMLGVFSDD